MNRQTARKAAGIIKKIDDLEKEISLWNNGEVVNSIKLVGKGGVDIEVKPRNGVLDFKQLRVDVVIEMQKEVSRLDKQLEELK